MMDLVISPLIFLGSAALVGFIWVTMNYWKTIQEIPPDVGAEPPIPLWLGLASILSGLILAWGFDWHFTAIATAVFGLGVSVPAAACRYRDWRLSRVDPDT